MLSSTLSKARRFWDAHATRDPLWAILTEPTKKHTWSAARFFETGEHEIRSLLYELDVRGIPVPRGSALDFGCGAGRLSQALAAHFGRVVGIDISAEMLRLAERFNRYPERVSYICSEAPDLRLLPDHAVDFVVSNIVLQHLPPEISLSYVREFIRVCKRDGVVVFQLPSHVRTATDPAPPIVRPMTDESYNASILVRGIPVQPIAAGSTITLDIEIANRSTVDWRRQAAGVLSAGNHWWDRAGRRLLQRDDGRAVLPDVVKAGESARVGLTMTAPAEYGEYRCEVDVVHEGVVWFREKGSSTAMFEVRVGEGGGSVGEATATNAQTANTPAWQHEIMSDYSSDDAHGAAPSEEFPMHGADSATVTRLIEDAGGVLAVLEPDRSCGDDWVSYRYFVRVTS